MRTLMINKNSMQYYVKIAVLIAVLGGMFGVFLPKNVQAADSLKPVITSPNDGKRLYMPVLRIKGETLPGSEIRVFVNGKRKRKNTRFTANAQGNFSAPVAVRGHGQKELHVKVVAVKHRNGEVASKKQATFTVSLAKSFLAKNKEIELTGECVEEGAAYSLSIEATSPITPDGVYTKLTDWSSKFIDRNNPFPYTNTIGNDHTVSARFLENTPYKIHIFSWNSTRGFQGTRYIENINDFDKIQLHTYCN